MSEKPTDKLDDTIANLELKQAKLNSKLIRLKLRCNPSVSSAPALQHLKRDSFDLSKLVSSVTI